MLDSYDGRHENVNLMAMDLEGVIAKQLSDAIISFHDFSL